MQDSEQVQLHLQGIAEKERQALIDRHNEEIEQHKAEIARVTSSLTERINQAEANLVDLEGGHKAHIEELTSDNNALIAAAETRRAELEAELTEQITTLKEALAKAQLQLIVPSTEGDD